MSVPTAGSGRAPAAAPNRTQDRTSPEAPARRRRAAPGRGGRPGRAPTEGRSAPWLAPLVLILAVFYLYPSLQVFRFSFTDASLLRADFDYGFSSYVAVLTDPTFLLVVRITLVFVVASIVAQLALGMAIALAVQRGTQRALRGTGFVRTLVLSSWVMPGIVIGIVWQIVLNSASYGLANSLLATVGLPPVGFLSSPTLALWSVILANVWRGTAFSMILQYAGLQAIDPTLYEAGAVDGATKWQTFWHITLPAMRPILMINLVLISIQTFNTFDMVLALTGGGPGRATEVLALRTYNVIFRSFSLGQGSVLAVVMLVLSLIFTLVYVRSLRSEEKI